MGPCKPDRPRPRSFHDLHFDNDRYHNEFVEVSIPLCPGASIQMVEKLNFSSTMLIFGKFAMNFSNFDSHKSNLDAGYTPHATQNPLSMTEAMTTHLLSRDHTPTMLLP